MSYMVVHGHDNVHDVYLQYIEYQLLMRRNDTWHFSYERKIKYMLLNTIVNSLEMLTDSFQQYQPTPIIIYRMSLKQILHDKNLTIEINAAH